MGQLSPQAIKVELRDLRAISGNASRRSPGARLRSLLAERWLWILMVFIPGLVSGVYLLLIASNIYVSEVKYVVQTPADSSGLPNIGGMLSPAGISKSADDAHTINAYLISRDAMEELRRSAGLDQIYARAEADFLARYPRFFSKRNSENQFRYFKSMTSVKFDKQTGISTLTVLAFTPEDAQMVARKLIESGEALANRLTLRMRNDLVERATFEAKQARDAAIEVQTELTRWRNREEQVDPTRFSQAIVEVIARLSLELAQLRAQFSEITKASPQSPALTSLQNRIQALEGQIERERQNLAGSGRSLAPKIAEYELLQLERQMAERLFAATVTSQEAARAEAQKQRIYVERIVEPQKPDYPSYPYRLLTLAGILVVLQLFYMIANKIGRNIAHHGAFARYFKHAKKV